MHFGVLYHEYQVPQWALRYVDYQAFKKLLKASRYQDVYETLPPELAKVEQFYSSQSRELFDRASEKGQSNYSEPGKHVEHLQELLRALQSLYWFGYVNYVAFRRILKKLSIYHDEAPTFQRRLEDQSFVRQVECLERLRTLEALSMDLEKSWVRTPSPELVEEATPDLNDTSGWSAKEYAALRGHWRLMKAEVETESSTESGSASKSTGQVLPPGPSWLSDKAREIDRTQGHILVNLGASNSRKKTPAIDLAGLPCFGQHGLRRYTGYALKIGVVGGSDSGQLIFLPMLEDLTNLPIIFSTQNPGEAKLMFRLFRVQDYREPLADHVGSGVAILSTLRQRLATKHETLIRDHTIPILGKDTLDMIGSVTFSFQIVTPLAHPVIPSVATYGFWKDNSGTEIVGHRGSGANNTKQINLQIGENTIQSFLSAVTSGAACVEFDVQLTKDLVPVIFHDFLVMDTGGDVPLHSLTCDQFMHLNKIQSLNGAAKLGNSLRQRSRSQSEDRVNNREIEQLRQRMRYTEEGLRNEVKGNLRGFSIHEPATKLEELLTRLPETIAFNLEMKYPMLWEAEDRNMDYFALELNLFVDTVLNMIYRLGGNRSITFSSFSPEICILLALKQQAYPILFISKAGSVPTGDVRAGSLQQAIHFAKAWGLAGIVMLSDVFVLCPRLLRYAKSKGLVCGSYGDLNDDPKCAKIQADAGLDAIMVNKVRLIKQTLSEAA
ncbi:MAG: hypothetical protein Q9182_002955 [Xanthomendoza sp. 2 TL-2023]